MPVKLVRRILTKGLSSLLCVLVVLSSAGVQDAVHALVHPGEKVVTSVVGTSAAYSAEDGDHQCWFRALLAATFSQSFHDGHANLDVHSIEHTAQTARPSPERINGLSPVLWQSARGPPEA